ncbi:MAG: sterol desaturase family protein, partial [Myxococcales bacterium]|nr:sterol desaturase family protein [Myxococcales bacterium]
LLTRVHYLHHQSRVPTPFSGYSLHVVEALIVFFDEILVCFVLPMHVNTHRLYHLYTTLIHIGGHASIELHPLIPSLEQLLWIGFKGIDAVSGHLNTVLYHNLHHKCPSKNLSLYVLFLLTLSPLFR